MANGPHGGNDYKVFQAAKELVEHRWLQGDMWDGYPGGHCLIGAVGKGRGMTRKVFTLPKSDIKLIEKRLMRKLDYWLMLLVPAAVVGSMFGSLAFLGLPSIASLALSLFVTLSIVTVFRCNLVLRQGHIEAWNDAPWRMQEDVVRVLAKVVEACRLDWLEDEALRLSIECSSLREEIDILREKLALAEAENQRLWRRMLGVNGTEADKEQLAQLEAELSDKAARMEQLETSKL